MLFCQENYDDADDANDDNAFADDFDVDDGDDENVDVDDGGDDNVDDNDWSYNMSTWYE